MNKSEEIQDWIHVAFGLQLSKLPANDVDVDDDDDNVDNNNDYQLGKFSMSSQQEI